MRISADPKTELIRTQTEAALALEALPETHAIRAAGQLLIGESRELVRLVPDQLPRALDRRDRQLMTEKAAFLREKSQHFIGAWQLFGGGALPSWLERRRSQTEAEFFDTWMREIQRVPYEMQHGFFANHPREEIEAAYRTWLDLHTRRMIRERHLPVISQAMAMTAALDAISAVARLSGEEN